MRFHILGLPHTVSSKLFNACAYTQKVVKFGKMMTQRGHEVIHYGHEDSDLICSEHVSVITNKDFEISYGTHDWRKNFFKFDLNDHAYQVFFKNAIIEIEKRKQKNDFLLPFWGAGVKPICDAHADMIVVEPGIGYGSGHWAQWKVFESYAIYHAYCGLESVTNCKQNSYEVVIPNYFDLEDFEFNNKKEDYFLYLGRVFNGKGVDIAIQACEKAGVKLVIAGQKDDDYQLPSFVEYVGYADTNKRKELMSKAKASFIASQYLEPFGGVQIENLLCGTPTITTDWGCFAENNLHGITGFRCRTMGDYVNAIKKIHTIKPEDCREWGENFSLEKVAPMYEKFFTDVYNVYNGAGWYEPTPELFLQANKKKYPSQNSPKIKKQNKTKKILFFVENSWCFGKIHNELIKVLYPDIHCDVLDWTKAYTIEGMNCVFQKYDYAITTPQGAFGLNDSYKIPLNKIAVVAHSNKDIKNLFYEKNLGSEYFDLFKAYAAISPMVQNFSIAHGVKRIPKLVEVGCFSNIQKINKSKEVKKIGYIGSTKRHFDEKTTTDLKRGYLVSLIAEKTGLELITFEDLPFICAEEMYSKFDILIFSSLSEGLPTVAIEALCAGIPIIGTETGIFKEIAQNGCGIILPFEEKEYINQGIKILLELKNNPLKYQEMVSNCVKQSEKYDWSIKKQSWINFINSLYE